MQTHTHNNGKGDSVPASLILKNSIINRQILEYIFATKHKGSILKKKPVVCRSCHVRGGVDFEVYFMGFTG